MDAEGSDVEGSGHHMGDSPHGRIVAGHEEMPQWGVTPDVLEDHSGIYRYA